MQASGILGRARWFGRARRCRAATQSTLFASALLATPLVGLGASDGGQAQGDPAARCMALAQSAPADTVVTPTYHAAGAETVAGSALAAHCQVDGKTNARVGVDGHNYAIGFRLRLPDQWNGRFVFVGGGGNDGTLGNAVGPNVAATAAGPSGSMVPALQQGYAVVSTDGGHTGVIAVDFGTDPLARVDHAYNAFDKTAMNAKALIGKRYGRGPDHSYFIGCSGGGRQGMMFTQRFPGYFDGVIAHAPAMRVSSGATIAAVWNTLQLEAIAPLESGAPILSKAFSAADLALVSNKITAQCDALDGAADGMVNNFQACHFDPAVLRCSGEKDASCLSAPQVSALQKIFAGPSNSAGARLYPGQVADPGIDQGGWTLWTLGTSTTPVPNSRYVVLMVDALRGEFFTPPDLGFDMAKFNFDTDPPRMVAESSIYDTYADAKLERFKAHGGKLMFLHGLADPIFTARDTVDYYERLVSNNGGLAATQEFSRLFAIPGENHCGGGRATDIVDPLTAMVAWVEKGVAPETLPAAAAPNSPFFPNRTRPLCPYPKFAKYKGSGSLEDAASFTCAAS